MSKLNPLIKIALKTETIRSAFNKAIEKRNLLKAEKSNLILSPNRSNLNNIIDKTNRAEDQTTTFYKELVKRDNLKRYKHLQKD